jgi:hypothetical protein
MREKRITVLTLITESLNDYQIEKVSGVGHSITKKIRRQLKSDPDSVFKLRERLGAMKKIDEPRRLTAIVEAEGCQTECCREK